MVIFEKVPEEPGFSRGKGRRLPGCISIRIPLSPSDLRQSPLGGFANRPGELVRELQDGSFESPLQEPECPHPLESCLKIAACDQARDCVHRSMTMAHADKGGRVVSMLLRHTDRFVDECFQTRACTHGCSLSTFSPSLHQTDGRIDTRRSPCGKGTGRGFSCNRNSPRRNGRETRDADVVLLV